MGSAGIVFEMGRICAYLTSDTVVVHILYSVLATAFSDLLIIILTPDHISVTLLDTILTQTCKSMQWLQSQTARTSSREMVFRTTSRASTKSTTSGVSAMTAPSTRAPKIRRMSLRWAGTARFHLFLCCLHASLSLFSFPISDISVLFPLYVTWVFMPVKCVCVCVYG